MGDLVSLNVKTNVAEAEGVGSSSFSGILVPRYLHNHMVKDIVPIHNWVITMFSTVVLFLWSSLRTMRGRNFCCLTLLS